MDYSAPQHGGNSLNKHKHSPKSSSELLSSAKLVAEAAKSTFSGSKSEQELEKAKVADAAADLICAASHFGKLEDKALGKYVDKAEEYLHQYHASHGSGPAATAVSGGPGHADPAAHKPSHADTDSHKPSHASVDGGSNGGSGYGDYFKMAQGFLKK